ncbi:MAG TPA: DUF5680 domain-containing protein, partial [Patescibacteria group bacterium]|nr:DUF5680 domain-containing protein [Patescibacteria group bacterium]
GYFFAAFDALEMISAHPPEPFGTAVNTAKMRFHIYKVSLVAISYYTLIYYGWVAESVSNFEKVYGVLQRALSLIPKDKPFRGPAEYREGNFIYRNLSTGEIENFSGEETISHAGKEIYKTKYIGGFVNQRK